MYELWWVREKNKQLLESPLRAYSKIPTENERAEDSLITFFQWLHTLYVITFFCENAMLPHVAENPCQERNRYLRLASA